MPDKRNIHLADDNTEKKRNHSEAPPEGDLISLVNVPTEELIQTIEAFGVTCNTYPLNAFIFIRPKDKTMALKNRYKPIERGPGLYSEVIRNVKGNKELVQNAQNKMGVFDQFAMHYNNPDASLKMHISINNLADVDKNIVLGLIQLLIKESESPDNNVHFHFKLISPNYLHNGRFSMNDQFTIYFDKYSSIGDWNRLASKVEEYLKANKLSNTQSRGPKDKLGLNSFVSARYDNNKLLERYNIYPFFDLEIEEFFNKHATGNWDDVPLCALEVVFYAVISNPLINISQHELTHGLCTENSTRVQLEFDKMFNDPKAYIESHNIDPDYEDTLSRQLFDAIKRNKVDEVKILLYKNASVSLLNSEGHSPLQQAILSRKTEHREANNGILSILLESGATADYKKILFDAIEGKVPAAILEKIIKQCPKTRVDELNERWWTALHSVLSADYSKGQDVLPLVKLLVTDNNINAKTKSSQRTALMMLTGEEGLKLPNIEALFTTLIEAGADVTLKNDQEQTALDDVRATMRNNPELQEIGKAIESILLKAHYEKLKNAIGLENHLTTRDGGKRIKALLENNPDNNKEWTDLLLFGIEKGVSADTIELLLKEYPDQIKTKGLLQKAIKAGYSPEVIQRLIDAGADVNEPDKNGHSALLSAGIFLAPDIVDLLIKNKANINVQSEKSGVSVLYSVLDFWRYKSETHLRQMTVKLLENNPLDPKQDIVDDPQRIFAARKQIIKSLMDAGIDTSLTSKTGKSVLNFDWPDDRVQEKNELMRLMKLETKAESTMNNTTSSVPATSSKPSQTPASSLEKPSPEDSVKMILNQFKTNEKPANPTTTATGIPSQKSNKAAPGHRADVVSLPSSEENVSGPDTSKSELRYLDGHFGYAETKNSKHREAQEDALCRVALTNEQLTSDGARTTLTPVEIGHRLWTSYQILDTPDLLAGTTASTTVYDGHGNLITATVADAAAFAVAYNKSGEALGVVRLNSVTHKPTDDNERKRIEAAGGGVFGGRVNGILLVSRAIGDNNYELKTAGVCSEATIDITNINKIISDLGQKPEEIGSIQIITTCDGFTDAAYSDDKKQQEEYLLKKLKAKKYPGITDPRALAQYLVEEALGDQSQDNISVAIQNITIETKPFLLGVYDGHGGDTASKKVAQNIGTVFKSQCALSHQAYTQQEFSVAKKPGYTRDNDDKRVPSPQNTIQKNDTGLSLDLTAFSGQLRIAKAEFEVQMGLLKSKEKKLADRGEFDAQKAGETLRTGLESSWNIYLKQPNEQTYKQFKKKGEQLFNEAHKILDTHRGWSSFLVNLALGVFTAGIGLLVKGVINKTYFKEENRSFFFVHKTDAAKVLDDAEKKLFSTPGP